MCINWVVGEFLCSVSHGRRGGSGCWSCMVQAHMRTALPFCLIGSTDAVVSAMRDTSIFMSLYRVVISGWPSRTWRAAQSERISRHGGCALALRIAVSAGRPLEPGGPLAWAAVSIKACERAVGMQAACGRCGRCGQAARHGEHLCFAGDAFGYFLLTRGIRHERSAG